jgi:hypothetical protein
MAGDEDPRRPIVAGGSWWKSGHALEYRVDARVAGYVDFARHVLGTKIRGGEIGRSEQKFRTGVDRRSILLFRPGEHQVMRAKPSFNMRDWHVRRESCKRGTKCARCIALNHQQVRAIAEQRGDGQGHGANMRMRILSPRAGELNPPKTIEPEFGRIQVRVLPAENDRRLKPLRGERVRNG